MQRRDILKAIPATLVCASGFARAQTFPARPIKYIVPVAAGGGSDMVGRTVTERWGKALAQTFVVDNQGGGGGTIASQNTAKASADGYTLMQGYVATHGTSPATRKLGYDAVKDFTPIGMIGATPNVLVVNAALPISNLKDLREYLMKNPTTNYGSAGPGSLTHLTMELFKQEINNSTLTHVPYRGIAPAFTDLLGGQTQMMFPGLAAAMPYIKGGRVRPLAVTGTTRSSALRDVPTLEELGLKGFNALQWYGVVGPANMPEAVVARLNESLNSVLGQAELREKLAVEAVDPLPMSPAQFGAFIKEDLARWSALAKARNIVLDNN